MSTALLRLATAEARSIAVVSIGPPSTVASQKYSAKLRNEYPDTIHAFAALTLDSAGVPFSAAITFVASTLALDMEAKYPFVWVLSTRRTDMRFPPEFTSALYSSPLKMPPNT